MKRIILMGAAFLCATVSMAQYDEGDAKTPMKPFEKVEFKVEMQGSFSNGKTPLWLNANKYGLSSLEKNNGYFRASVIRPLEADEERKWGLGYGIDLAVPVNYTSKFIVQQAYVEGRWLHGSLMIGAKEIPMELKNNSLSSGAQTLGKNARPVPQVRLALHDYWAIPGTKGWLKLKGHIAYGKMTDDNWQHDFTGKQTNYADDVLFHSKAGYLKIGNEERYFPWSLELGLEMACTFGGTGYIYDDAYYAEHGTLMPVKGGTGLKDYWNAFVPGGSETIEEGTYYQNAEGNHVGSWLARINYDADDWRFSIYADKYFEDHSSMLQLDYDGYGTGENWDVKEKHNYFLYGFHDWMLGLEYHKKYDSWLNTILVEYLYTKYQSGPIYHDHSPGRPDSHICGMDNYYNHYVYTGWQHWGQVMGNPLYRSPIYNTDGTIEVKDNRFMGFHLGIDGQPSERFGYKLLATWQEGLGTYMRPYTDKHHNFSFLLEGNYKFITDKKWLDGTSIRAGYAMDFGAILGGTNYGFQLTIAKTGIF